MFVGDKHVSQGVTLHIPAYLQNILWYLIESLDIDKDYLQTFELKCEIINQQPKQKIIHSQEQPPYQKEYIFFVNYPINAKLFVVDDGSHSTMLLAEEY
ncbi:DUF960 family protein [Anaerosolibacter sp.]|uniref:DUF960 family protein n=1 Tax=Anaerosolibacter sp. TaxID=1872527 RepID=UPI0039EE3794